MIVKKTTTHETVVIHDGGYLKATMRGDEPVVIEVMVDRPFKIGWLDGMIKALEHFKKEIAS